MIVSNLACRSVLSVACFTVSLVLCLCFGPSSVCLAENEQSLVYWDVERPISWDDFQATVPTDKDAEMCCVITTGITWKCQFRLSRAAQGEPYVLTIPDEGLISAAWMDPQLSWVDSKCVGDRSLDFMQLLFDVYRIYSAQLRIELLALEVEIDSPFEADSIVHRVADRIFSSCDEMAQQCTRKTSGGIDSDVVDAWRVAIDDWLEHPGTAPIVGTLK